MSAEFRKLIADRIASNREKLSASSLKTYVSILFNLHKHLNSSSSTLDFFEEEEQAILDYLKDAPPKSRKSVLSALFVLTNNPSYREKMLDDCKLVNSQYKEQKKDTRERDNWISVDDIKVKYNDLLDKVKAMFSKNICVDSATIINYLLIALLGGVSSLAPRRSLDYALMKIRNYDMKKDNNYKAGKMYFNQYKTANKYGKQEVKLPEELNNIIKKWMKVAKGDFLLFSSNGNPLTSSQISRMLNKIFDGKKISVDILRHIYLSDLYKGMPSLLSMEKTASKMGHSVQTALTYVKRD